MQEIKIRRVTKEDLEPISEIERLSFEDFYSPTFMDVLYRLNRETFLVAEKEGKIVGYVIATNDGGVGHIISIAIQPSERRKHIGWSLMAKVLDILKESKVTTVRLEVKKSNVEAQKFYEALGFKYYYTIDGYYGDEDGLVYFKSF